MKDSIKVLKKIQQAKDIIRKSPVKKEGRNTYSNYDYYTPDQIVSMVQDACHEVGIITMFGTYRDENGLNAKMTIVDIDSGENIEYNQVTDIPAIKATNVAQQLGGMNTYSNRYLLMFIFDIVDNNLDFDTTENTKKSASASASKPKKAAAPKKPSKVALTEDHPKWSALVDYLKGGGTLEAMKAKYTISKAIEDKLNNEVENG